MHRQRLNWIQSDMMGIKYKIWRREKKIRQPLFFLLRKAHSRGHV